MKQLIGHDVGTYSFDKSTGKITLSSIPTITLEQILLVTDTTANVVIYQFDSPALGGSYASTVLTLTYNTSALNNTDTLQIYVDIPAVVGHVIVDTAPSTAVTNVGTFATQPTASTSGGTGKPFSASLTATKQQIKATSGNLYSYEVVNNGSTLCYIQVFNLASASVTVGSTAPDWVIPVPAPSSGTNGAGISRDLAVPYSFSTGMTVACTTTRTGSSTATCDVNFFYN